MSVLIRVDPSFECHQDDSSYSDGSSDSEAERWSLSIKISSLVDMPSNFAPSIPLCPVLKIGLITIHDPKELEELEMSSAILRRAEYERSKDDILKKMPQTSLALSTGILADFQHSKSLIECLPHGHVRCSSGKIISKKDNGMVEWHEEMRWDNIELPLQTVIAIELSTRAVLRSNTDVQRRNEPKKLSGDSNLGSNNPAPLNEEPRGIRALWRKGRQTWVDRRNRNLSSGFSLKDLNNAFDGIEAANKAAIVAQYLMDHNIDEGNDLSPMDEDAVYENDMRIGTIIIPISNLPLETEIPRVEKWYKFDGFSNKSNIHDKDHDDVAETKTSSFRDPLVLLDICLSSPDTLDVLENESFGFNLNTMEASLLSSVSMEDTNTRTPGDRPRKRTDTNTSNQEILDNLERLKKEEIEAIDENGPYLEPGIIDYVCVVGLKDIENTILDDKLGWLDADLKCDLLEQFPPDEVHKKHGRECSLPNKIEWWCFPEGCRLWRGIEPPNHMNMNIKRFSASSPPTMASSIAAFDACLNCTSSFMWWVLSSNSDEYGSSISKTYGAVIRFYAPVTIENNHDKAISHQNTEIKLWCPIGICLTSSLPIIGVLEAVLLRLCEKLASAGGLDSIQDAKASIHADIIGLILHYQRPIPSAINCSIPFLSSYGERLLISLPPKGGLPALPHGASLTSVCRLLGPEGLTALLAAVLTECKILIHSADITNLAMVCEVITSLMYPFQWQLPFIPVLPFSMLEMVEAPLSYLIGVPTCNMKWIDKSALVDVVVFDLDNGFSSSDFYDSKRSKDESMAPSPLPASVSSNISKATFRLLREDEELQEQYVSSHLSESQQLPRLDGESLAEREFRVTVAHQICSLIRGYQECLFFVSSSQPVFNRDRFLRQAPALFEDRVVSTQLSSSSPLHLNTNQRMLSPRSKRFLSGLVNSQHFHQLLESLDADVYAFFHEIMESFPKDDDGSCLITAYGSSVHRDAVESLREGLELLEDDIPTYHVQEHDSSIDKDIEDFLRRDLISSTDVSYLPSFTATLLNHASSRNGAQVKPSMEIAQISQREPLPVQQPSQEPENLSALIYQRLFDIDTQLLLKQNPVEKWKKVHLREALGERKFNAWKENQKAKSDENDTYDGNSPVGRHDRSVLDLTKLMRNLRGDDISVDFNVISNQKLGLPNETFSEIAVIKRYIQHAYEAVKRLDEGVDCVADLTFLESDPEIKIVMRAAAAQKFLTSILSQRSRLQNERRTYDDIKMASGSNNDIGTSKLHPIVFQSLFRLCKYMLDACADQLDYDLAYRLIIHTTGFFTVDERKGVVLMTKSIGRHIIYSDLRLWDRVLSIHKYDRQRDKQTTEKSVDQNETDEYEATVSTLYEMLGYGMLADTLAKFAYRVARKNFRSTDREQKLLTLARRLAVKCEEAIHDDEECEETDLDVLVESIQMASDRNKFQQITWSHPSSQTFLTTSVPITSIACISNSIVASGGLDGSVFVAQVDFFDRKIRSQAIKNGFRLEIHDGHSTFPMINNTYDESMVRSISCMAVTSGVEYDQIGIGGDDSSSLEDLEGYRIIAGTKGGIINIWNLDSEFHEHLQEDTVKAIATDLGDMQIHSGGQMSTHLRKKKSESRFGRTLGGHRGEVTCISVPPNIYRPNSIISGGNDGLIKLWSLSTLYSTDKKPRALFSGNNKRADENVDVLSGHGGRILCIESAWHGDRIVSGAADRTLKLWDLAGQSGGRCLHTMHGHNGWVTHSKFWGRNSVISASSDRSIALWDTRTTGTPLCVLRAHNGPISDLYLESRSTYWMTSASSDGKIATWDFRMMRNLTDKNQEVVSRNHIYREPIAQMQHSQNYLGPVFLSRALGSFGVQSFKGVISASVDGCIREWDALQGTLLHTHETIHKSKISCFQAFGADSSDKDCLSGFVTASWDGKVEYRVITDS